MTCQIHFYLLNDHFSIEYANEHNNGAASELNRMYLWEDEFAISTNVSAIDEVDNTSYFLQGTQGDDQPFSEEIPSMRMFYLKDHETIVAAVGCSELLLSHCSVEDNEGSFKLSVFMKGEEPLANPVTGIYIASKDFPKSLIS